MRCYRLGYRQRQMMSIGSVASSQWDEAPDEPSSDTLENGYIVIQEDSE